jgi:predicted nucleotidyltransferase
MAAHSELAHVAEPSMKSHTRNALSRQSILRALRRNRSLLKKHGVRRIGLFGSYATASPHRRSDIDFRVEFERPTFDNFIGLSRDLGRLFSKKVETVTPDGLDGIRVKKVADDIRKALVYG